MSLIHAATTIAPRSERSTSHPQPQPEPQVPAAVYLTRITDEPVDGYSMSYLPFPSRSNSTESADLETGDRKLILDAQNYVLPPVVKALADSYIQIASNMALITALFAGVQISMAQVVFSGYNSSIPLPPGWSVLHFLTYAGIYLNTGATASALAFINYAGYLTASARVLLLTDPSSWPYRVFYGEPLPLKTLNLPYIESDFDLMIKFGLKQNMRPVWHALSYGFYSGSGLLFISLGVWIWLNESIPVAICLTILVLPPAGWLTSSFFFTAEHIPSVPKELGKNLLFCGGTVLRCSWDV